LLQNGELPATYVGCQTTRGLRGHYGASAERIQVPSAGTPDWQTVTRKGGAIPLPNQRQRSSQLQGVPEGHHRQPAVRQHGDRVPDGTGFPGNIN